MAKESGFSFNLDGINVLLDELDKIEGLLEQRLIEEIGATADDVVFDTRELAPWDKGDLIAGVMRTEVETTGEKIYVDIGVSNNIPYALRMHEDVYQPGLRTETSPVNSPRVSGQLRGRKYLERALQANEKTFRDRLSKILEG